MRSEVNFLYHRAYAVCQDRIDGPLGIIIIIITCEYFTWETNYGQLHKLHHKTSSQRIRFYFYIVCTYCPWSLGRNGLTNSWHSCSMTIVGVFLPREHYLSSVSISNLASSSFLCRMYHGKKPWACWLLPPQLSLFLLYVHQPTLLISIILQEVIALVNGQDMMRWVLNLSQKVLAGFFNAM